MGLKLAKRRTVHLIGVEYEDVLLYLVSIFRVLGLCQMIVDGTLEHRFYSCIPHVEGIDPERQPLEISGVFYGFSKMVKGEGSLGWEDSEMYKESDIIFRLYDYSLPNRNLVFNDGDVVICFVDEHRRNIESFEKIELETANLLVIRNYTGTVKKRIERKIGGMGCDDIYALPFYERDLVTFIKAEYGGICRFNGLSGQLKACLKGMAGMILHEFEEKDLRHAFKIAEKGGKK